MVPEASEERVEARRPSGTLSPMPTFRSDVSRIAPYVPGRPIAEVARALDVDPETLVKLASNESPIPPFPAVQKAIVAAVPEVNRYPDNDCWDLRHALGKHLSVPPDHVWVGAGSSEILRVVALAVGGPGTSAVYGWPSFSIYRLGSIIAMSETIEVPLDSARVHDLDAMATAVRPDTTIVYVCNPNNPTGTYLAPRRIAAFVDALPETVTVLIDEAYDEYVTAPGHVSAIGLALERPNVVVARTFSKIFGLAALRVGYAVARPETIAEARKAQAPFTVTSLGQVAAVEALAHPDELEVRRRANSAGRDLIENGLAEMGVEHTPSQANFVACRLGSDAETVTDSFLREGVIVRPFEDGWVRVSVGAPDENGRFLDAVEALR